jgi:hypothetical protein
MLNLKGCRLCTVSTVNLALLGKRAKQIKPLIRKHLFKGKEA